MSFEVRVLCEYPNCEETERAVVSEENFDCSSTVCRTGETNRFHFTLDSGWIDGPEDWVLGQEDQILCPKHAPAEPDPEPEPES